MALGIPWRLRVGWARFWMCFAGGGPVGRVASRLAVWLMPPLHGRYQLSLMNPRGYVSASARIWHSDLQLGRHVFVGDRVVVYQNENGGSVTVGANVKICNDVVLETGAGGTITIGENSRCQFRCHLAAYKAAIHIGKDVGIAQGCSFYSHDHGRSRTEHDQLISKGPIIVEDGVWLGAGVTVLSGVRIGKESVVAAGAVVTRDIPEGSVAAGNPARVIKQRFANGCK